MSVVYFIIWTLKRKKRKHVLWEISIKEVLVTEITCNN